MKNKLITIQEVSKQLNVCMDTLRRWDKSGKLISIRTKGGHRRYLQSTIDKLKGIETRDENNVDCVAIYCRVSSQDQKKSGDLDKQKARLLEYCVKEKYNIEYILEEVCSGMKSKRPKLNKLYKLVQERKINKVIIEHKDRLARFMFDVFEEFFNSYDIEIVIINEVLPKSFENELVEDMLSLLSSFSSRIYGKRSAERRKQRKLEDDKKNIT